MIKLDINHSLMSVGWIGSAILCGVWLSAPNMPIILLLFALAFAALGIWGMVFDID